MQRFGKGWHVSWTKFENHDTLGVLTVIDLISTSMLTGFLTGAILITLPLTLLQKRLKLVRARDGGDSFDA